MADGGDPGGEKVPEVPASQPRSPTPEEEMSPVKMKRPAAGKAKATPKKSPATPKKSPATPKKSPAAPKKSPVKKHTMKKPSAPPKVLKKPSGKLEEKTKPEEEKSKQRTEKNKKKRAEEKKKKEEEAQKKAAEAAKKKGKGGSKGSKGLKEEAEKETGCQEEGGEEEQEEVDPLYEDAATFEEETEPKKDRCKDKKFKALLASNALPEHIVEHWNRIKKMTVGRQKEERKLVNAVFDRSKTGELLLATSKPQFQLLKAQVEKEVAKSTEKSLPKSLFKGKFHLSEEDFQLGLQAGDFCEVVENGKAQYCWQSSEVAKSKEQLRKRELSKTAELDEAQAKLARHHVGKWSLKCLSSTASSSSAGASGPAQLLALEDRAAPLTEKAWQAAQGQLLEALQALGKLETSGKKMLQNIGVTNKDDPIYPELFLGWYGKGKVELWIVYI